MITRRDFFVRTTTGAGMMFLASRAVAQRPAQQPAPVGTQGGGVAADTLAQPTVGAPAAVVGPHDNDPRIIGIEKKLHCQCGCTLDVYTCRTTDFTCTVSPAMHAQVVSAIEQGASADQIIQGFVTEYGGNALMSPPAQGLSLAGYLVPGLSVIAVALGLVAYLMRRRAVAPVFDAVVEVAPDAAQLEQLKRALDEVES
jgi:cytochrome c-type biogenesis protein CcmH